MAIGKKNRRLTLQRPDGVGGFIDVETVWGSRTFHRQTGPEALAAGAPMAIAQWLFVVSYQPTLRAEWRVIDVDESRTFQVSAYGEVDDRLVDMQLFCSEIQ